VEYRQLGRSGVPVSVIGIGSNQFGRAVDEQGTARIIHQAIDRGINHIDTADIYTGSVSEQFLGKALAGRRDQVVLATKTGMRMNDGVEGIGLSRRRVITAVEASLKRLNTDYIDLYYMHQPDPKTPIEETMRALDDLVTSGKIRYSAFSNFAGWQVAEIVGDCERRGYQVPIVSQSLYNLIERDIETELIPACEHFDLSIVPFSPLGSGFLTGKYQRNKPIPEGVRGAGNPAWQERRLTDKNFSILEVAEAFAAEHNRSVSDLAIAWLLGHKVVCSVIAGVTKPEQVEANAAAADWALSADDLVEFDRRLTAANAL
jgi:aryl-alcohol dehydrogenase-like predicted oxidoreductase